MTDVDTLPCDLYQVADGVLVVPHLLPFHVPAAAYGLTVKDGIGVNA